MRNSFCDALVALGKERPILFFTGDLGFMALEKLRESLGDRFVNAGIAEQNMVGVAAGAASQGEQCWAYSIAPFAYARPFEQIRNDVCLHDFDVKVVGNGGGYGYGVMGATHHALEDYGVLCTLQNMRAHVPAFAADVGPIVAAMSADRHPAYLRLGRCEKPAGLELPPFAPWRKLLGGGAGVMVAVGPLVGPVLGRAAGMPFADRPEIWVATKLPFVPGEIPEELMSALGAGCAIHVLEEHVAQGGAGHMLAALLLSAGVRPGPFLHFHARGYQSGRYGSQAWHRAENGLDAESVLARISAGRIG